jgi:tetratricopeptide (TPR) repeat protein
VKDAALKAIAIDDSLGEAHTSLAFVRWVYDWDWPGAETEFRRAIELNPRYATAHEWYAYYLAALQHFDQAVTEIKRAQEIEPVSLGINTDVGEIYYWSRQYDRAIDQLKAVIQVEPSFPMARNIAGLTYLKRGQIDDALEELERARSLDSGPRMISRLGHAYGLSGARNKARNAIRELQALSKQRYTSAFAQAIVYAGLNERDQALRSLERAYAERSDSMVILRVYPPFDGLRDDPRFRDLLRPVGPASASR